MAIHYKRTFTLNGLTVMSKDIFVDCVTVTVVYVGIVEAWFLGQWHISENRNGTM